MLADAAVPVLGTYMGLAGDPEISRLVEHSDALLLLGAIISDTNFGVSGRRLNLRHAIHAENGAVSLGYHTYPHIPLEAFVDGLLARVQHVVTAAPLAQEYPHGMPLDAAPITPTDVACAVNDLFARHGRMPLASDMGDCLFTALDIDNTELVSQSYYATMLAC